ncbi:hypothetical protein [Duganella callida]|uniref:Uncharacterized protein n=1 Tax=Duganella callida TaxID=2561932 RepID=A0A4Y9SCN0_9BURK|nr:hypothetical protein [Duganella callida]TFW17547.1 hypothetical protein E4L98_20290 [Duganella callida]
MNYPKKTAQATMIAVSILFSTQSSASEQVADRAEVFVIPKLMRFRFAVTADHARSIGCHYQIEDFQGLSALSEIVKNDETVDFASNDITRSYFVVVDLVHNSKNYITYAFDADEKNGNVIAKITYENERSVYSEFPADTTDNIRKFLNGRNFYISGTEYKNQPCNFK